MRSNGLIKDKKNNGLSLVMLLFFASGVSALMYQVAWQRILFTSFGIDLESVTIIVSAFMAGLGLGALLGGWMADRWPERTLILFSVAEASIGMYGIFSADLFHWAGQHFVSLPLAGVALVNFLLVFIPTLAMGATLPVLISFLARRWGNIGAATGVLYSLNTIGAAVGSTLVGFYLFYICTITQVILIASLVNLLVSLCAFLRFR